MTKQRFFEVLVENFGTRFWYALGESNPSLQNENLSS